MTPILNLFYNLLSKLILSVFTFILICRFGSAQNIESIGKKDPLKITGGISTSNVVYTASGIESRRDPYNYFFSGNLNFSLYGWNVPLSFTFSNQNSAFQQPFNQYGLHPTYKSVTGHLGYVSMSFSPYTLSGHLFQGVGVDIAPKGKFKYSAMYGRLQKAVEPDTLSEQTITPYFKRMGYGMKVSYVDGADFASLIVFGAKDDINSISYVPADEGVLPEENLVLSVSAGKSLFERLVIDAEFATSAITRDLTAQEVSLDRTTAFKYAGGLFTPRTSSNYYSALKSGLTYKANAYSIGLGYERIDPGYRTLGAYYFNSDLENITVNAATAFFNGKVSLAVNVGKQRDNLDNTKISTLQRWVSSTNVAYAASPKLNLAGSYSNFQTFTNIRSQFLDVNQLTPYDNLDTLNFTQISQNANLNVAYILSSNKNKRQNINANLSFQNAADEQGGVEQNSGSQFYSANTSYSLSLVPRNTTITVAFNYNKNEAGEINSATFGPTLAVSKTYFEKKLRTTFSSSMNDSYSNSIRLNRVMNYRLNGSYSMKKKHNLNLSMITVNRNTNTESAATDFTELTTTFGYSYNF